MRFLFSSSRFFKQVGENSRFDKITFRQASPKWKHRPYDIVSHRADSRLFVSFIQSFSQFSRLRSDFHLITKFGLFRSNSSSRVPKMNEVLFDFFHMEIVQMCTSENETDEHGVSFGFQQIWFTWFIFTFLTFFSEYGRSETGTNWLSNRLSIDWKVIEK